ncbi:MAG: hypothetical protein BIFFINMI_03392 [Phycisphaerae bacterium]|nr:hypothetical protein [Phycisphaerae bacterium]
MRLLTRLGDRRVQRWVIGGSVALAVVGLSVYAGMLWVHEYRRDRRIESLDQLIRRHAKAQDLPVWLVREVVRIESGGDPTAQSGKGALGLMQVTPIAKREVQRLVRGVRDGDLLDPDYNMLVGTTYLRLMVVKYDGDLYLALAAYNAGPHAIDQLRRGHAQLASDELVLQYAPRETQDYCRAILRDQPARIPLPNPSTRPG